VVVCRRNGGSAGCGYVLTLLVCMESVCVCGCVCGGGDRSHFMVIRDGEHGKASY
jgi:hypothetical protein